jgi:hypothetical protein
MANTKITNHIVDKTFISGLTAAKARIETLEG